MGVLMGLRKLHSEFGSLKRFMSYLRGKEDSLLFKTVESLEGRSRVAQGEKAG